MSNAVDIVERQLQALLVLREAGGKPVPRSKLVEKVPAYGRLAGDGFALKKLMQNDHKALVGMGFAIEDVAPLGEESRFVLRTGPLQLPVELEPYEQGLLVWVTAAAGATAGQERPGTDLSGLLGAVPRPLGLVQTALATSRSVVVERGGEDVHFEPGLLVARAGRWFVLGRYAGSRQVRGLRLDRMEIVGLGRPLTQRVDVGDPDAVLDSTAWAVHESRDAELRCRMDDLGAVRSWFPRAAVEQAGHECVLRFPYRNEEALLTRVIGLAGSVRIAAPEGARSALLRHIDAVLEGAGR